MPGVWNRLQGIVVIAGVLGLMAGAAARVGSHRRRSGNQSPSAGTAGAATAGRMAARGGCHDWWDPCHGGRDWWQP